MVVVLGDSLSFPLLRSSKPQSIRTALVFQRTDSRSRILGCGLPPILLPIPGNTPAHPSRPSSATTCTGHTTHFPATPVPSALSGSQPTSVTLDTPPLLPKPGHHFY